MTLYFQLSCDLPIFTNQGRLNIHTKTHKDSQTPPQCIHQTGHILVETLMYGITFDQILNWHH